MNFIACANDVQEDIFQGRIFILTAGTLAQFLQCSLGHQYALVDNAYSRTESLDDLHNVGREKDGCATLRQVVQDITYDTRTDRVNPFKWLIQEKYFWTMYESSSKSNFLAHTH